MNEEHKKLEALGFLAQILGLDKVLRTVQETDDTPKEEGDIVQLMDKYHTYYFKDFDTGKQLGIDESAHEDYIDLKENTAIVVETGKTYEYNCGHCDDIHLHDMIIYYPHNKKKYYVRQNVFKVVD